MTVDNLILYLFGLIVWFTIVISFLVTILWRNMQSNKKLIGFLMTMRFPYISSLRSPKKNATSPPLDKKSEKELRKALSDLGVDVKEDQNVKAAVLDFLNSDQVGPRREAGE